MPHVYYVYVLFDWRGIPFYVGKGKGSRWLVHETKTDLTNQLKNEIIEQTWVVLSEIPKVKIREQLSEKDAFDLEIQLIKTIGRRDLKRGTLVNLTDGGDGTSGYVYPQYLRELRSIHFKALRASESFEIKSARSKKAIAAIGSKALSDRTRTQMAALTPEARSERAKRGNAKLTPEQRSARALLRESRISPKDRRARSLRAAQRYTPEERSTQARHRQAAKSPETRKAEARKGAETRKANNNLKPRKSIVKNCLTCGTSFYVKASAAEISKYCCHPCYAKSLIKLMPR